MSLKPPETRSETLKRAPHYLTSPLTHSRLSDPFPVDFAPPRFSRFPNLGQGQVQPQAAVEQGGQGAALFRGHVTEFERQGDFQQWALGSAVIHAGVAHLGIDRPDRWRRVSWGTQGDDRGGQGPSPSQTLPDRTAGYSAGKSHVSGSTWRHCSGLG